MGLALVATLALAGGTSAPPALCAAEGSAAPCLAFSIIREGLPVPKYSIVVREDGRATYRKTDRDDDMAAPPMQDLSVSDSTRAILFKAVPAVDKGQCETRSKGIAQTGRKTLRSYRGDAERMCVFNYSDEESVNAAANAFQSMATTLQFGEQLAAKRRFDRLALDAMMETLVREVKDGRAIEVQNIAPVLRSLAEDDRVIDRVRRSAARLLQDAGVEAPEIPDKPR